MKSSSVLYYLIKSTLLLCVGTFTESDCCKSGFRGDQCQESCDNCKTQWNGEKCSYYCAEGYFGSTCNNICPSNCHIGLNSQPLCEDYGTPSVPKCVNGCREGYFGLNCSQKCNRRCKNEVCFQITGKCLSGSSTVIDDIVLPGPPWIDERTIKNFGVIVPLDTAFGATLILLAVVVIVWCRLRICARCR